MERVPTFLNNSLLRTSQGLRSDLAGYCSRLRQQRHYLCDGEGGVESLPSPLIDLSSYRRETSSKSPNPAEKLGPNFVIQNKQASSQLRKLTSDWKVETHYTKV